MHIPDGFLDTTTSVITWAAAAGGVAYAVRRVSKELDERQVPLMGVSAAFIFAAQMLNFTVAGGTSGHLLGGALAGILLGPWAGMLVLTSVLSIQALLFQDGGLLALGANVFNMAVLGVLLGWAVYTGVKRLFGNSPRSEVYVEDTAGIATKLHLSHLPSSAGSGRSKGSSVHTGRSCHSPR